MTRHRIPSALALAALLAALPARAGDWSAHGLLDLTLSSGEEARELDVQTQGDSNFDPYRVRLYVNGRVAPSLDVVLEAILHEGAVPLRADGAYAQWTPWADRDLHVQAGKIPWAIGTWDARAASDANPLVGAPLMEQYHTALAWNVPVTSVDALVASAGKGQYGLGYGAGQALAMPVLDDRWWDVGAALVGSARPLEFALATSQGTPGWPVTGTDVTPGQTVLGRLGLAPAPGVRAGVSGAWGNWMPEWFERKLPPGGSLRDYHEWLGMGDLDLERGRWELRGEGYLKGWQTIALGDLRVGGGYGEFRLGLGSSAWFAARAEAMRFSHVRTSAGIVRPWDDGIDRYEAGFGYRVTRDVRIKAAMQRDVERPFGGKADPSDVFALSASIRI